MSSFTVIRTIPQQTLQVGDIGLLQEDVSKIQYLVVATEESSPRRGYLIWNFYYKGLPDTTPKKVGEYVSGTILQVFTEITVK